MELGSKMAGSAVKVAGSAARQVIDTSSRVGIKVAQGVVHGASPVISYSRDIATGVTKVGAQGKEKVKYSFWLMQWGITKMLTRRGGARNQTRHAREKSFSYDWQDDEGMYQEREADEGNAPAPTTPQSAVQEDRKLRKEQAMLCPRTLFMGVSNSMADADTR